MAAHFLTALAAAFICVLLLWVLERMIHSPVKSGKNTVQTVLLSVRGREPALENNVNGLLWLNDTGVLRCRIVIAGTALDDETRFIAQALERDYSCITFIENEEDSEWIGRTS